MYLHYCMYKISKVHALIFIQRFILRIRFNCKFFYFWNEGFIYRISTLIKKNVEI